MCDLKKDNLEPTFLTDKTRLNEICRLRVLAWEHTDYSDFINRQLFPEGLTDHLDKDGLHWIIQNDKNEIIGSVRFNILHDLKDLTEQELYNEYNYPRTRPFGFISRMVVHPSYRQRSLSFKLEQEIINYSKQKNIGFSITGVAYKGIDQLKKLGFKVLGKSDFILFSDKKLEEGFVLIYEN